MTRLRALAAFRLALVGAGVGLSQCDRDRVDIPVADAPAPAPRPQQTALGRADIVAALAQAGANHAEGGPTGDAPAITGRTFLVKLAFGCNGPDTSSGGPAGLARWAWSPDRESIRLTLTPADLTRSPVVVPTGQTPVWDKVEGYWIARPWMAAETCPRPSAPPVLVIRPDEPGTTPDAPTVEILRPFTPPPSPQTSGLAVIQGAHSSRLGRRAGEAYSFVVHGAGDQPALPPVAGYRLVLAGRIGAFPDGRAIRCTSENPDRRPVCLAAVELDTIAFEDASGARLSEWRPG